MVVFDIDGTLIDSRLAIYFQMKDWSEAHSLVSPTYQQIMGLVHKTDLKGMVLSLLPPDFRHPQQVESFVNEINNSYVNFYMPKYAFAIDDAIGCLLSLKRHGFKLGFVTNATKLMMDHFIQLFNLHGIVDIAVSADDVSKPKPHPMGILKVLSQLNIEPENALFVGDSTTDVFASKAANVLSVGVLSGVGKKEDLQEAGADFVIESVASLRAIGI